MLGSEATAPPAPRGAAFAPKPLCQAPGDSDWRQMGGRVGWKLVERSPEPIVVLFAVTPALPPNILPRSANPLREDTIFFHDSAAVRRSLRNTERFPYDAWHTFVSTLVPESPRAVNEGRNAAGRELDVENRHALREILQRRWPQSWTPAIRPSLSKSALTTSVFR